MQAAFHSRFATFNQSFFVLIALGAFVMSIPVAQAFDIENYFILTSNSQWHYTGDDQPGSSSDDDFTWIVLADKKQVAAGKLATKMKTITDEGDDSREQDEDYWFYETNGDLNFYGFHNGQADGGGTFPVQDIVLTDPIKFGTRNMSVGTVITDTGAGSAQVMVPITGAQTITMTMNSRVEVLAFIPVLDTGMGPFNNVLRLKVEISGTGTVSTPFGPVTQTLPVVGAEFMLAQGLGMIAHDQTADPNDAERQVADAITINGLVRPIPRAIRFPVTITAGVARPGMAGKPEEKIAGGSGTVTMYTTLNQLFYNISINNLSSTETATTINGFKARGAGTGTVKYTLPNGAIKRGVINYNQGDEYEIMAGLTYVLVQTVNNPAGESRGQIDQGVVIQSNAARQKWEIYE
jgi:hypothetical protein